MNLNGDDLLFCKHIEDLIFIAEHRSINKFSRFLTEHEQNIIKTSIHLDYEKCCFFGGYEESERKIFGVFGKEMLDFPITAVSFTFKPFEKKDRLTHRDVLGAVMSCGIKRDSIGDILLSDNKAVVFCTDVSSTIIISEISKIGKLGVTAKLEEKSWSKSILPTKNFVVMDCVVSSLRVDSIISAVLKKSRDKSADMIKKGLLSCSGKIITSISHNLKVEDKFTVKGYGKFLFAEEGTKTKSGRLHIKIKKYT